MKTIGVVITLVLFLAGCEKNSEQDFQIFIEELKLAAENKNIEAMEAVFSDHYIQAAKFMRFPPSAPNEEVLKYYTEWMLNDRVLDKKVIRYSDKETFTVEGGIYTWLREAEYKGYEGETHEIDIDFIFKNGLFVIPPHFTYPSMAQLEYLDDMQNIYSLYFAMDNVASYEVYENNIKQVFINPDVSATQLQDVRLGDNNIKFTFVKENEALPVLFAATVVSADRNNKKREVDVENIIHLSGEAIAKDSWGDFVSSQDHMITVEGNEISMSMELK